MQYLESVVTLDWKMQNILSNARSIEDLAEFIFFLQSLKSEPINLFITNCKLQDSGLLLVVQAIEAAQKFNIVRLTIRNCEIGIYTAQEFVPSSTEHNKFECISIDYPSTLCELKNHLPNTGVKYLVFHENMFCPQTFKYLSMGLQGSHVQKVFIEGNNPKYQYFKMVEKLNNDLKPSYDEGQIISEKISIPKP